MSETKIVEIDLEKVANEVAADPVKSADVTSALKSIILDNGRKTLTQLCREEKLKSDRRLIETLGEMKLPSYRRKKTIPGGISDEYPYGNPNAYSDYATYRHDPDLRVLEFKTVVIRGIPPDLEDSSSFHQYLRGGHKTAAKNKSAVVAGFWAYDDLVRTIVSKSRVLSFEEKYDIRRIHPDGTVTDYITIGGRQTGKTAAFKALSENITRYYLATRCGYRGSFEEWKKDGFPIFEWVTNGTYDPEKHSKILEAQGYRREKSKVEMFAGWADELKRVQPFNSTYR